MKALPCSQYVGVFFYYYYYYYFHYAPHTWQSSRKSDCLLEASTTMQRLGVDHPLVWNPCHLSQYVHSARSYHGLGIYRPTYCASVCKVDHRTCDPCQGSTADVECYLIFKSNQDQDSDISLEHHMFLTRFAF